jgi:hypothetical protein
MRGNNRVEEHGLYRLEGSESTALVRPDQA